MPGKIFQKPIVFINYRRSDSASDAGRLSGDLDRVFGEEFSFLDVENLQSGDRWIEKLIEAGLDAKVILVIIGEKWLEKQNGQIRLFDKGDWVRRELLSAMESRKIIIPILIDKATLPDKSHIPQELHPLLEYQAFPIRKTRWKHDLKPLIEDITKISNCKPLVEEQALVQEHKVNQKRQTNKIKWVIGLMLIIISAYMMPNLINKFYNYNFKTNLKKSKTIDNPQPIEEIRGVKIGDQIWMSNNLAIDKIGSLYHPDVDTKRDSAKYGRLYTFDAALKTCPEGWHLPSLKEWTILANSVGGYFDPKNSLDLGNPNKSYSELTKSGNNHLGITLGALASEDGAFSNILNKQGFYWTSTKEKDGTAHMFRFREDYKQLSTYAIGTTSHLSCRCIKDGDLNEVIPSKFANRDKEFPKSKIVYFSDNYGNRIRSVKIGSQIWMAENVNTQTKDSKCYENDPTNCKVYGRLYNWYDAMSVCPDGWHLPSDEEWKLLMNRYGGYYDVSISESVGTPKKSFSALVKNGRSKFNSLLGGSGSSDGKFWNLGHSTSYWSSTKRSDHEVWYYNLYSRDDRNIRRHDFVPSAYFSCRCIKNDDR